MGSRRLPSCRRRAQHTANVSHLVRRNLQEHACKLSEVSSMYQDCQEMLYCSFTNSFPFKAMKTSVPTATLAVATRPVSPVTIRWPCRLRRHCKAPGALPSSPASTCGVEWLGCPRQRSGGAVLAQASRVHRFALEPRGWYRPLRCTGPAGPGQPAGRRGVHSAAHALRPPPLGPPPQPPRRRRPQARWGR